MIQVTLVNEMINHEKRTARAVVHQIWNQQAWLDCERLFRFTAEHLQEAIPRKRLRKIVN